MNEFYESLKRKAKGKITDDLELLASNAVKRATDECSYSQLGQDRFALIQNGFKRDGYFVEFGATDGKLHSNTHLLEKGFGWSGILAEPEPRWHEDLRTNRDCHIETDCIWSRTGETLDFCSSNEADLSTIAAFSSLDSHAGARKDAPVRSVETISLMDLLAKYEAPRHIDYFSVDTEGSELNILSAFDFSAYHFNFVTIEHNFTSARPKLRDLMEKNGYQRVFESLSKFDDWYVPSDR